MADYAAYVDLEIVGKKWIFFKKYRTDFMAIYYDDKFYKKSKWPGHIGRWGFKFQGKGEWWKTPEKLDLPNIQPGEKIVAVNNSPSPDEYKKFCDGISGDFEVLDSAKYRDKKFKTYFTVYNIYDNKAKRYVIFIVGNHKESNRRKYQSFVRFVEEDLRKWFQDKKNW